MKILFDQGTPAPLRRFLGQHDVFTAYEKGWSTLQNGDLIRAAESEGFELMITTDGNLKYQQNLKERKIAIMVILSTSWPKIQLKTREIFASIDTIARGSYIEIPI